MSEKQKALNDEKLDKVTGGEGAVSENEDKPNVIIDSGTGYCKPGFSGEEGPRTVFPAVVGKPKSASAMVGSDDKNNY